MVLYIAISVQNELGNFEPGNDKEIDVNEEEAQEDKVVKKGNKVNNEEEKEKEKEKINIINFYIILYLKN